VHVVQHAYINQKETTFAELQSLDAGHVMTPKEMYFVAGAQPATLLGKAAPPQKLLPRSRVWP